MTTGVCITSFRALIGENLMPKTMVKQYDDSHNLKIYCHEKSCLFGYEIELLLGWVLFMIIFFISAAGPCCPTLSSPCQLHYAAWKQSHGDLRFRVDGCVNNMMKSGPKFSKAIICLVELGVLTLPLQWHFLHHHKKGRCCSPLLVPLGDPNVNFATKNDTEAQKHDLG
jgi:hypothetical protein